jgi:hypothetical protein
MVRDKYVGVSLFKSIAALAFVGALSLAGAAQAATVYTLHLDTVDPTGELSALTTEAGTITVTDTGLNLFISVAMENGFQLRHAPDSNHHSFVFNSSLGHATISNISPTYFHQDVGTSFSDSPFGSAWNNAIDCTWDQQATGQGCSNGAKPGNPTTLSFKVAGIGFHDLVSKSYTGANGVKNIFFAVDVVGSAGSFVGRTGNVGATWDGSFSTGVPEPASWALMIAGFGFVGAGLRRRRAGLAAA